MKRKRIVGLALTGLLMGGTLLGLGGCGCGQHGRWRLAPGYAGDMEGYARERYRAGICFLTDSRFELAEEQFAIAEKTAESEDLRQQAQAGRQKAAAIIEARR